MAKKAGLKIALVSAFPPGQQSLNEYGLHLAKGFAERQDVTEVVVLADRLDGPALELDLGPKIRVRRVWSFNSPFAAVSILCAIRHEKADAALFNIQTATFGSWELPAALGLCAPMLTRVLGTPSGVLAHNLICGIDLNATQVGGQKVRQSLIRIGGSIVTRALLAADYLAVTLDGYREMLARDYPNANVSLIPHGTFDTAARDPLASSDRPMRLVTMGKFGTYKRLETLLTAFDLLRDHGGFPDLELVIGGADHPSAPGYIERVLSGRSDDPQIKFAGYLPEDGIPDFFGEARVSVFDYDATTGSSGVLHQTASYGAVPVFPQIGDFVDVCRDEGLGGMNYRPGDAAGMAAAIASVLRDPNLADGIAEANRLAALGMPFSEVISRHLDLFREIMPSGEKALAAEDALA